MAEWLRREVVEGLQALVALRLDGAPAADMVVLTANIWEQAFEMKLGKHCVEEVDAPRIQEGFRSLFPTVRKWPAPVDVLERMPSRPPRPALPEPKATPEQHQESVKKVKAMVDELLGGWGKKGRVRNG